MMNKNLIGQVELILEETRTIDLKDVNSYLDHYI